MISKRILISMIVIISLAEFITCPSATQPDPAASKKTGVKPRATPKAGITPKTGPSAIEPTDPGMDPDDETATESEKSNGLRKKLLRPIKFIFLPLRLLWGKFKDLKNRVQQKNNKESKSDGEKPIDKNKKKV
ncbi:uncharacterized protein LOC132931606 [Rhopalosiphum padi]|uniref:uncharacterized protein LOC132931606 n=1 Tax=Rhopalosiphum padi TaxID=40932 RepID=UPI00298D60CF|nr:uncharacterized protein LOC132931606 [Rhopalosiphum padi]